MIIIVCSELIGYFSTCNHSYLINQAYWKQIKVECIEINDNGGQTVTYMYEW